MAKCKDCQFYEPSDEFPGKGDCYGHEVDGETDADSCPTKSFQRRQDIE